MKRNLLLGNGINMHLLVKDMTESSIAKRFSKILINSNPFYELLFGISFTEGICNKLFSQSDKKGIESLAYQVHEYILRQTKQEKNTFLRMQVLDEIVCSAITAIFYKEEIQLGHTYNKLMMPNFEKYDKIFTLNYAEFWDENSKCNYLHGKYDLNFVIYDGKPVLHYSKERYTGNKNYKKLVENMSTDFNMCELNTRKLVFSPEFYEKKEMIRLGACPGKGLYPAKGLYPHNPPKLYDELNGIENIEIFGMSPYGDESLIDILNEMKNITIYIYIGDRKEQEAIWKEKLNIIPHIKDSHEIMKFE